jgi:hypothetical protein
VPEVSGTVVPDPEVPDPEVPDTYFVQAGESFFLIEIIEKGSRRDYEHNIESVNL